VVHHASGIGVFKIDAEFVTGCHRCIFILGFEPCYCKHPWYGTWLDRVFSTGNRTIGSAVSLKQEFPLKVF
jgi:hypothetical protein